MVSCFKSYLIRSVFITFSLPLLLVGCGSEATQHADSSELLDYDDLVFEPAEPGNDIIPDVIYNYLNGFDYPDSLLLDTTLLFDAAEPLNREAKRLQDNIQMFVKANDHLPEYASSNLNAVNNVFYEYILFKLIRDQEEPKTRRELGRISLLIRNGMTTIKPEYLVEVMETFPEEIKSTDTWRDKRALLEPQAVVGLSLFDLPDLEVYGRDKSGTIRFQQVLAESSTPTVLIFTASWCGPCKVDYDRNRILFQELESEGVRIISYSLDKSLDDWTKILNDRGYVEECYIDLNGFDSLLAQRLHISAIPAYILLSAAGEVENKYGPPTIATIRESL